MSREIGISKIKLFPLTKDEPGQEIVYGDGFDLPWAVSFETEVQYAQGEYYGDNIVENAIKKVNKMDVTIEVSSNTPPEIDAKITGKLYKNGKVTTGISTLPKTHAVGYEILMDDGTVRKRMIYKVALSRNGQNNKTQEDGLEGETYKYEGIATPLLGNKGEGALDTMMDEKEVKNYKGSSPTAQVITNHFEKFFTKPILPGEDQEITK